jgi:hypothetical protein
MFCDFIRRHILEQLANFWPLFDLSFNKRTHLRVAICSRASIFICRPERIRLKSIPAGPMLVGFPLRLVN